MRKLLIPFLLFFVFLASCKKETTTIPDMVSGQNFYPAQIGKYIVYNCDSTIYDDFTATTTVHSGTLRYLVTDTFRNSGNQLSYTVSVQYMPKDSTEYMQNDVIAVTPTSGQVVVVEKNISFIKMVFPVSNNKSWNGNALIPIDDLDPTFAEFNDNAWNYTYANFDTDFQPSTKLYNHTVTINEINDTLNNPDIDSSAYAFKNYKQEIYGYNVGLVYRERTYWVFQPKVDGSGGSGYRSGYSVVMKAIDNN